MFLFCFGGFFLSRLSQVAARKMDRQRKKKKKKKRWRKWRQRNHAGLPETTGRAVFPRMPQKHRRLSASTGRRRKVKVCGFLIAIINCYLQLSVMPVATFQWFPLTLPGSFSSSFFPTVTPSDSLVRRSISQQKSGVSVTIDDPVRTTRQPSPPRGKVSNIIHVTNLVGL